MSRQEAGQTGVDRQEAGTIADAIITEVRSVPYGTLTERLLGTFSPTTARRSGPNESERRMYRPRGHIGLGDESCARR